MRRTRSGLQTFFTEYDRMTQGNPDRAEYGKTLTLIDTLLAREVIEPTREYLRLNEGMLAKANEENRRIASRITTALLILGVCGPLGGMLAGWVISSAMRRTHQHAEDRLRSTARQLDEAARTAEVNANRAGRSVDALDDVTKSASAVLARLKQTERDALRAEQLAWAGQMAAGIAHEVRNPLMAIKLLIQALAEGRTGDRLRPRDVQVLEEEILRLEQIVDSFLDFARPPRLDRKSVEVGPLVEQVVDRIRGRAKLQAVAVECDLARLPIIALQSGASAARAAPPVGLDLVAITQELLDRGEPNIYSKVSQVADRAVLESVLRHTGGNQVIANKLPGISRTTLRSKLQSLGILIEKQVRPDTAPTGNDPGS